MKGFTFQTARSIVSEPGAAAQLGTILAGLGVSRALVVTDPGIVKAKLLDGALASLGASGIAHHLYTDVVADPPEAMVLAAVEHGRRFGADGILGFGGGSSLDTAKLVAFLLKAEQKI
ncbi:MAG: iron-containing alcohol dehydrogenase, partial [Rhodospirillaceae bacterium]|nr:iron-containing alcohol dehydrogenase [Rhodospirillaceae bacterium]